MIVVVVPIVVATVVDDIKTDVVVDIGTVVVADVSIVIVDDIEIVLVVIFGGILFGTKEILEVVISVEVCRPDVKIPTSMAAMAAMINAPNKRLNPIHDGEQTQHFLDVTAFELRIS